MTALYVTLVSVISDLGPWLVLLATIEGAYAVFAARFLGDGASEVKAGGLFFSVISHRVNGADEEEQAVPKCFDRPLALQDSDISRGRRWDSPLPPKKVSIANTADPNSNVLRNLSLFRLFGTP